MEPQGRGNVPALHTPERNKRLGLRKTTLESRGHVQTVGLNAETTTCRHRAEGEECLLTFPLIGLFGQRSKNVVAVLGFSRSELTKTLQNPNVSANALCGNAQP